MGIDIPEIGSAINPVVALRVRPRTRMRKCNQMQRVKWTLRA
jgi:hypothetical protein